MIKINELGIRRKLGRRENCLRILESGKSWQEMIIWAKSIAEYKKSRRETLEYYTVLYNNPILAEKKMKEKSDSVSGDKNPWSSHDGKYSPFKKGSVNYSKEAIDKANENRSYNTRLDHYIDKGLSKEEAEESLSERQATFTLEKCVERLGEEQGRKRWIERQEKWQNTLNSKDPEELARIAASKLTRGYTISKAEKELFEILSSKIPNVSHSYLIRTGSKYLTYDIALNNKLIEYNGDYWHCNPNIYESTYYNKRTHLTAEEMWKKDEFKLKMANDEGFEVLVIWESDYKKNKEKVIKECLAFLTQ